MTCPQAQSSLSLYLYGELDFAHEEELESHIDQCAFCQRALEREKQLHTLASAQVQEPSLDLLAQCRQQFRPALARETAQPARRSWEFSFSRTSWQLALASLLVFIGFASARLLDRRSPEPFMGEMSVFDPANSSIRDIQADGAGQIRIVFDRQSEISGRIGDANIRRLLLAGARQPDPDVRFASFEILAGQAGAQGNDDLRTVFFEGARNDPNSAIRVEAVQGLRFFNADPAALETLKFVLEHDGDAGVRSQAIDILAPLDGNVALTPASAQAIQDVMRSAQDDDYVRDRCTQVLYRAKLPVIY
jgi:anti-sigma factor RsiW